MRVLLLKKHVGPVIAALVVMHLTVVVERSVEPITVLLAAAAPLPTSDPFTLPRHIYHRVERLHRSIVLVVAHRELVVIEVIVNQVVTLHVGRVLASLSVRLLLAVLLLLSWPSLHPELLGEHVGRVGKPMRAVSKICHF